MHKVPLRRTLVRRKLVGHCAERLQQLLQPHDRRTIAARSPQLRRVRHEESGAQSG